MNRSCLVPWTPVLLVVLAQALLVSSASSADPQWPQWRGAGQRGVAATGEYPIDWKEPAGDDRGDVAGIVWDVAIPGNGGSTPVVAGDRIYLTSGVGGQNQLLAVDAASGELLWQTSLGEDRGNKHRKGGGSNPSCVTDGDHVFAYFRSGDLACVDRDGRVVWQHNLQTLYGEDTLWWDLGSSPLITPTSVVCVVMQTGPSYLVAFDKSGGEELWKTDRNTDAPQEAAQSYTTPLLVDVAGTAMIAVMGGDVATLHRVDDGKLVGTVDGFNPQAEQYNRSIASPVAIDGVLVCPYSRGTTVTGIDLAKMAAGAGRDSILWHRDDIGSDVPTPAAAEGRVYFVSDTRGADDLVIAIDAKTGQTQWTVPRPKGRLGNAHSSSPLIAGDHLYVVAEDATTRVIGPLSSPRPAVVATNTLADTEQYTVASPVPIDGGLLIRTRNRLTLIR